MTIFSMAIMSSSSDDPPFLPSYLSLRAVLSWDIFASSLMCLFLDTCWKPYAKYAALDISCLLLFFDLSVSGKWSRGAWAAADVLSFKFIFLK